MSFPDLASEETEVSAALRHENRRLRALLRFTRQVTAERDLHAQLRLLSAELLSATGCLAAAVVLRDPDVEQVDAIETAGLSLTTDLAWQQAVRAMDAVPDEIVPPAGFERLAALPLVVGDDRLGVALAFDCRQRGLAEPEHAYLKQIVDAAALAIQHARLYAQSHRELRRRDALRRVVASISSELDQDSLFKRVMAGAVELLDTDGGVIGLIDPDGTMRIRAVHNLPETIVGRALTPGESIAEQVPGASGMAVPVWWHERIIGVFGALAHDHARVFSSQDRETMELLASHVAIALDNARLYGEVRERLAEVTGLQAASTALAEELHPERALRVLAEQALLLSGAATVSIELLRSGGRDLEVQVAVGENAVELAAMRVSVDGSLAGMAVASGQPQIALSQLVLPLRARGRTLGTLTAYTRDAEAIRLRQVELLATFASQAAVSLDNAQLYAELTSRLEEMVGLQRLGTLLLEEHDFDRVLHSICRQLQRLTDAGGVGIALLEEDPRFLEMRTVVGPSAGALRGARIPTEGSFAAEALRTNRPQRSDDAQNDPRGYKYSLVLGNTRTILSVPMKTRQRTVGVLSVYNKEGEGGFSDRDADLATFFANQAAAAIENARLYAQTREYAVVEERNRLARELHDSVTQSLFSVTLLSEAALNLLERDAAKARERLERASELAQGALAEMRALIFQLRPMTLQEEGLLSALKKHLNAVHSRDGRLVALRVSGAARRLPAPIEDASFGIIQEGVNNVVKHAHSERARVELHFEPHCLRVAVVDAGVGFDLAAPRQNGKLGMTSMRERAESAGGHLYVESAPGQGTHVRAEFSLTDASASESDFSGAPQTAPAPTHVRAVERPSTAPRTALPPYPDAAERSDRA